MEAGEDRRRRSRLIANKKLKCDLSFARNCHSESSGGNFTCSRSPLFRAGEPITAVHGLTFAARNMPTCRDISHGATGPAGSYPYC